MATPFPTLSSPRPRGRTRPAFAALRARPALWVALALSVAVHLAWSLWPVEPPTAPEDVVLSATLTEMPAPPAPVAARSAAKPDRPKVRRPPPTPAKPAADIEGRGAAELPPAPLEPLAEAPLAPLADSPLLEQLLSEAPPPKALPPRLDLAYKVFLGTQGFLIGEATYRFEHSGGRYHISTVAQARGLAALILRGKGRIESRGTITRAGLRPEEFVVERGSSDRREVAVFDWDARVVTLHDDQVAVLEAPSYDPMTVMWQPYFTPPDSPQQAMNIVTTRRVIHYRVEREGVDTITWTHGEVEAERWHRQSDDGRTDAWIWLAPSLHYVPVKMRVSQTMRGTLEVLLDGIRVDEPPRAPDGDLPQKE